MNWREHLSSFLPAAKSGRTAAVERDRRVEEVRRLVDEGLASGFEPYEGSEAIKAEGRRKLSNR